MSQRARALVTPRGAATVIQAVVTPQPLLQGLAGHEVQLQVVVAGGCGEGGRRGRAAGGGGPDDLIHCAATYLWAVAAGLYLIVSKSKNWREKGSKISVATPTGETELSIHDTQCMSVSTFRSFSDNFFSYSVHHKKITILFFYPKI